MKLRKVLLGSAAALALAASASAANADGMRGSANAYERPFSWTGFYVGLQLGGGWGDASVDYPNFASSSSKQDLDGVVGGGQLGFNKQWGGLVLGAEVSLTNGPRGTGGTVATTERQSVDVDLVVQAVGRLGYTWGPTMLYGLGGYAGGRVDERLQATLNTNAVFDRQWHNGWVAGVGVEHMIHPNVIFGVEWRHVDLGDDIHSGTNNFGGAVATRNHRVDVDYDVVVARLSIKFDDRRGEPLK